MTGRFFLDWAVMAVSLFNTTLLLWLGFTVLLNAERRTWGVWAAGGGLLMGGTFFVSHSAILGYSLDDIAQGLDFWWHIGWVPVIVLPFAWYVVMLWYAGFWEDRLAALYRRQRPWLFLSTGMSVGLVGLLIFANPLPSFWQLTQGNLAATPSLFGLPLLMLAYPVYIVLCIALTLDVLRSPGTSGRVMGDLARRRARPWLVAASVALLLVSLLVTWAMVWIVSYVQRSALRLGASLGTLEGGVNPIALAVARFDLSIAALIGLAVLLLGQAIVSYELFTGKTLPRRGLFRHWRSAVILAGGYSALVSASLALSLRPIYNLLLTTILMIVFYALFGWRSYVERDRTMDYLRPFVTSQRLYEHLLAPATPAEVDVTALFYALCNDLLEARVAYLVAMGPLAPLIEPSTLAYPEGNAAPLPPLGDVISQSESPQAMCVPLDPNLYGGALWLVPLWGERGIIGALLLGEKRTGGLYTQEEIEIARASGERLIDTQASVKLAHRLMALQRQRLVESQVIDRRARRLLHDDVLPNLHAAMLMLSGAAPQVGALASEAMGLLMAVHRQISNLLRDMPTTTAPEVARLGLVGALRQAVDEELAPAFDSVMWDVDPEAEREARVLPTLTAEVLFYAARETIRNAARHGRGEDPGQPLTLQVAIAWDEGLMITIEDDGAGISASQLQAEGEGQGLALHSTMMAVIGGTLTVESVPDTYTRVSLLLPWEIW